MRCQTHWLCLPFLFFCPLIPLLRPVGRGSFKQGSGCGSSLCQFSHVSFKLHSLIVKFQIKLQPLYGFLVTSAECFQSPVLPRGASKVISERLNALFTSLEWSRWKKAEWNKHSQKLLTSYLWLGTRKAAGAAEGDYGSLFNRKVPSLWKAVGSLWFTGFSAHFSLILFLPHTYNMDLDNQLLQIICLVKAGTKWGPADILGLLEADVQARFLV